MSKIQSAINALKYLLGPYGDALFLEDNVIRFFTKCKEQRDTVYKDLSDEEFKALVRCFRFLEQQCILYSEEIPHTDPVIRQINRFKWPDIEFRINRMILMFRSEDPKCIYSLWTVEGNAEKSCR